MERRLKWLLFGLAAAAALLAFSRSRAGQSITEKLIGPKSIMDKYPIIADYIPAPSKRRSGQALAAVKFVVAHDTGNTGSTARNNVNFFKSSSDLMSASAHIFVDDKNIIECVPALTGLPEKAWHVRYNAPKAMLVGFQANDYAIGIEYCFGANIDADEAYKRYVWVMAYICNKYHLDPATTIIGHFELDPGRKTDPVSGLAQSGRTFDQLKTDVASELVNFQ